MDVKEHLASVMDVKEHLVSVMDVKEHLVSVMDHLPIICIYNDDAGQLSQ